MRLAGKLTLAIGLGICLVQGAYAIQRIERESSLFETDMRRDHRVLGYAVAVAVEKAWAEWGEAEALELVEEANARHGHVLIEWMPLPGGEAASGSEQALLAEALADGVERSWIDSNGDKRELHTVMPVSVGGRPIGGLHLSESLEAEQDYIDASVRRVALATATTVAVSGVLTLAMGLVFVGRPIRNLVGAARRIGAGDLTGRLDVRHKDEVGDLAREINVMCDHLAEARESLRTETESRIATLEQLRHADRLTTVGKLAAGVAHELGTPLNVVLGRARMIASREVTGQDAEDSARTVAEQADRMTRIIRQLLDFARRREPHMSPVELGSIVDQTFSLLASTARKSGVRLERRGCAGPVRAVVDPSQIQQVLTNIVMNGIQAMPGGGELSVEIASVRTKDPQASPAGPERDWWCLRVRDTGEGIPPEVQALIFDPFFTTKEVGAGTGLGLPVSHGIVREHAGWIEVESDVGRGSCFSIYLAAGEGT